jgi:hypothetical protein
VPALSLDEFVPIFEMVVSSIQAYEWMIPVIDRNRLIFYLWTRKTKSIIIAQKSILKLVNCKVWLRNVVKYEKYSPVKLANFEYFSITRGKNAPLSAQKCHIFPRVIPLKHSKFVNFTWLHFPYFTIFCNQTLQFY